MFVLINLITIFKKKRTKSKKNKQTNNIFFYLDANAAYHYIWSFFYSRGYMGLTKEIYIGGLHRYWIPPNSSKKKKACFIGLLHMSPRAIFERENSVLTVLELRLESFSVLLHKIRHFLIISYTYCPDFLICTFPYQRHFFLSFFLRIFGDYVCTSPHLTCHTSCHTLDFNIEISCYLYLLLNVTRYKPYKHHTPCIAYEEGILFLSMTTFKYSS